MSIVLVDSRYFGHYLARARKTVNLRRADAAKMLNISHSELIKIENGKMLIPDRIVEKLMINGLTLILSRRRNDKDIDYAMDTHLCGDDEQEY